MSLIDRPLWPNQTFAISEVPNRIGAGSRQICLTSPTGGGKSIIACRLILWALANDFLPVLYSNRKMLVTQLCGVLKDHGIDFGIRASGKRPELHKPVQISSLPTERSRSLNSEQWALHGSGKKVLAILDEFHLNAGDTAQRVVQKHLDDGGVFVGVTATPIDVGHMANDLIIAGTPSELRRCGALVPAYHYGPDEPDLKGMKHNVKTGEFSENDVRKAIMTKQIFGRVLDHYKLYNDDRRPTILFAPGVKESIWFAEQLTKNGVRAAHIDGDGVWLDGEYRRDIDRQDIINAVKSRDIEVVCNRFVLREGIDIPELSHAIIATAFGALKTYLQSCGRILRACAGKSIATIQDHGGHWHRMGSVNADRVWNLDYTERFLHDQRERALQEKKLAEPITCAKCKMVRASGSTCPKCGFQSSVKTRTVMQTNGTLREHEGDIYKPRLIKMKPDTQRLWDNYYYRAKNSSNRMTFTQAEGLFFLEQHYWPPRDLNNMPVSDMNWYWPVADVPPEALSSCQSPCESQCEPPSESHGLFDG